LISYAETEAEIRTRYRKSYFGFFQHGRREHLEPCPWSESFL
jgi:hypothetical protein